MSKIVEDEKLQEWFDKECNEFDEKYGIGSSVDAICEWDKLEYVSWCTSDRLKSCDTYNLIFDAIKMGLKSASKEFNIYCLRNHDTIYLFPARNKVDIKHNIDLLFTGFADNCEPLSKSNIKLFAIVDDGNMAGDSEFDAIGSKVEYKDGMTLNDIRRAYSKTQICQDLETDVNEIKVAWIVTQDTLNTIENCVIDCYNDGQVYMMNRMLKEMARNLCIKDITE